MENENVMQENSEKSISLGELFFLAKKNIILILIITIVCTAIGGVYGLFIKERSYTASATTMVMVDTSKQSTVTSTEYSNYMYSTYLINTYKDFVVSHKVIDEVVTNLANSKGYVLTYKTITENLSISNDQNSLVVTLSYTAHGNEKEQESIDVVNEILKTSIKIVDEEKLESDSTKLKYFILSNSVQPIDYATSAIGKRGASTIIIISFVVGLVISFGIILIKYLTDDTFKSKEEFKRIFGIDVIATIPDLETIKGDATNENK